MSTPEKIVVLTGGCFDMLHFGHIQFLNSAKQHGNYLIVALESDENVQAMKGANRPIHTQQQRARMLKELRCVDEVLSLPPMRSDTEYSDLVTRINPAVIAVTEGDPIQDKKQKQADNIGAKLVVIAKIHTPSTSQLAKLIGLE